MKESVRLDLAADWLQRLQSSPRDEALVAQWADWCQADPENLAAFERIETVWSALSSPLPFGERALEGRVRGRAFKYALPLAASVLLALAISFFWWRGTQTPDVLTTNVAEHGSQILADGSHVDLGARTRILTRFTPAERNVVIETGEAFFDVAKDAKRPFVVQAGQLRIIAVGTAFRVRHLHDRTVVTVSEGVVRIAPETPAIAGHLVQAGAGEQVTFVDSTHSLSLNPVNPKTATAWREGILTFVNEPLSSVVEDVNRYSQREIVLADPGLRNRLYTGTIYRDRIDAWVRALEEVFPLEARLQDDKLLLLEKKK